MKLTDFTSVDELTGCERDRAYALINELDTAFNRALTVLQERHERELTELRKKHAEALGHIVTLRNLQD